MGPLPRLMADLVLMWYEEQLPDLSPRDRLLWSFIPHIVCSVIWLERNARIFY